MNGDKIQLMDLYDNDKKPSHHKEVLKSCEVFQIHLLPVFCLDSISHVIVSQKF